MKLNFAVIFFACLSIFCAGIKTQAQISTTGSGKVVAPAKQTSNPAQSKILDLQTVDFKNFTYPEWSRDQKDKTFSLKNGRSPRIAGSPAYNLRKTYYYDLTGDDRDEAITHIIAEGCNFGCESSSFFFIHTASANQPKILWKIAIGGDTMGGLKTASFKPNEIVLEAFGDCRLDGWLISPQVDVQKNPLLKTASYTRFVFVRDADGFTQTEREVLPLDNQNLADYKPQITIGE